MNDREKLDRIKSYLLLCQAFEGESVMDDVEFTYKKYKDAINWHNGFILSIIEEN